MGTPQAMEFVVILYANKSPKQELQEFHCPQCRRMVFRHNGKRMLLSNSYGASFQELQPGGKDEAGVPIFIEYKCHSCKSLYRILFQ